MRLLPCGWPHPWPGRPRPLTPPTLRYARASQLLRAGPPARPATVLSSLGFPPLGGLPLAAEGPAAVSGCAFTRSIAAPRSGSCCLYAGCRLGSKRVSPRLVPGQRSGPGFRHRLEISTRQRQRASAHRSSSQPTPDAIEPRLFPRRSAQRSSANAPVGGLEPPPIGRLRRARQPPSLLQHRSQQDHHLSICPASCVRVRNSAILLDLQPRLPQQTLGNDVGLAHQLRLTHAAHPLRLAAPVRLEDPAPWLHPRCDTRELHSYYERVRQRARRRYSAPRGFRRLEISLSLRKAPQRFPGTPSHVP